MRRLLSILILSACAGPVVEKPPCDEATLAQIVASCPDEETCNRRLDERQATCAKRIEAGQ